MTSRNQIIFKFVRPSNVSFHAATPFIKLFVYRQNMRCEPKFHIAVSFATASAMAKTRENVQKGFFSLEVVWKLVYRRCGHRSRLTILPAAIR